MTVSAVIPCGPISYAPLVRCILSLTREICDEIIVARFDASHLDIQHEVPVRQIGVVYTPDMARTLVERAFEASKSDWVLLIYPTEWLPTDEESGRRARRMVLRGEGDHLPIISLRDTLATTPPDANSIACPSLLVEDNAGLVCRGFTLETRLLRRNAPFTFDGKDFGGEPVVAPHLPVHSQPYSAYFYHAGDPFTAVRMAQSTDRSDKRFKILAQAEIDRRAALDALWVLFEHMSLYEEPWRLGQVLENLPYTLEDDPSVAEMRRKYELQMGHLGNGAARWYAYGSPAKTIDASYVELREKALMVRTRWLIDECRRRGLKRVLELGSVDGGNLFPMTRVAPDLEFYGVEVSKDAVLHAKQLSAETGVKINIQHAHTFTDFAERLLSPFDAVAVFEVLEHNSPEEGGQILDAAEKCVLPEGRIFITTPHGAWSRHNPDVQKVELRKDHIYAWTVKRMRAFLEARGAVDLEISKVENPQYEEANSWVVASYRRSAT